VELPVLRVLRAQQGQPVLTGQAVLLERLALVLPAPQEQPVLTERQVPPALSALALAQLELLVLQV
jgi:hypothetical protein